MLTIGFARRFATYKRADLIFRDPDRLAKLLNRSGTSDAARLRRQGAPEGRTGQAAHPAHREPAVTIRVSHNRLVFVEDYDINVCRHLVQGVDVWLNNPRRPLEASGTSGQKVVLNGGLNLSILDGWWAEAYDGANGFAIGRGTSHVSDEITDSRDAKSLYETLEQEVVPMFYDRDVDGLPRKWIQMMMNSITSLAWRFSAHRMVMDYTLTAYVPGAGGLSCDMFIK